MVIGDPKNPLINAHDAETFAGGRAFSTKEDKVKVILNAIILSYILLRTNNFLKINS